MRNFEDDHEKRSCVYTAINLCQKCVGECVRLRRAAARIDLALTLTAYDFILSFARARGPIFSIHKVRDGPSIVALSSRRPYPYYSVGHVRVKSGERYS